MGGFLCWVCIGQATVGIVEKWGRFVKLAEPGLHFVNPCVGEWLAGTLSTRLQYLDVRVETKTKDNVFVQLFCSIQYRVVKQNADDAFYELQNPHEQIQAYVFDVVRANVPRMALDDLFEQKGDVAQAVLEELEKVPKEYFEQLGVDSCIKFFEQFKSYEGLYFFLGAYLSSSEDLNIHFKYIEAATKTEKIKELEHVTRESNFYDAEKTKKFLMEAKLLDAHPLINVCDWFGFFHFHV